MQANTKLTKEQKRHLKELREMFANHDTGLATRDGVTIFVVRPFRNSNTFKVSTAVASPNEKKNRRKVGEYLTLLSMCGGVAIPFPTYGQSLAAQDIADIIAETV